VCLAACLSIDGRPASWAQSDQDIIKLLDAFKANPSKENAGRILQNSAKVDELRQAGRIPAEHANTLWNVDDIKVDSLNRQIAEAGKVHGNDFQVSIYGSDSRRPPTRSQLEARFPGSPPELIDKQLEQLRKAAAKSGYDVFRSDFDMCFTGPGAQGASNTVLEGVRRELGATPETLGLNGLSYPTVPGAGYDIRIKYIGNQEMYNSRAGIKWINRNMWQNGVVTYWDADAGRMVTQKISEYTGKAALPFKAPAPIAEEELFGFLADNWNQMEHHLRSSENATQRLKWLEKYLGRSLGEFPETLLNKVGLSAAERRLLEMAKAVREGGNPAEIEKHASDMFELYQNVMKRAHVAQIDLIAAQLDKNIKLGLSVAGDQKLRLMIEELAGSYKNFGVARAQALLADMAKAVGKDSAIYKALFTALEQAKDLRDEAAIMAELEKLLKGGIKPPKITRPAEAGKPVEAKLEDPFQKHAFDKGAAANAGDPDFGDASEFAKKNPNSGNVLPDKKIFSENFRADRVKDFENLAANKLKALTPEEMEKWRVKFRSTVQSHIANEIDQSWLARHKQWLQLPEDARKSTLYTRSFFNELGSKVSRLEGATATIKGTILRNKLITGILLVSAAYGWYTTGNAWGAVEAVYESGKAILVFEVINWICFTGAEKAAQWTGLSALGPIGWAIGVIYNVYEIGKLAAMLAPVLLDLMNRAVDTLVFGSASDLNARRFYLGGTYKSYLTGEMESPGFFNSLWNFNTTERGTAKSEKDLFPVFATPEELRTAIEKEWTDGAVGQKWYYMFGSLTIEKMQALALADWQKSFTLKLNEYLQSLKSGAPKDEDIAKFDRTSAADNAQKWTGLYETTKGIILGLGTSPSPPKPGDDVELSCDYMLFGLPGQSVETKLVLRIQSPAGDQAQDEKTTSNFGEETVTAEERSKTISVRKTFKLDANLDLSRTKFVAELYDINDKLIDIFELAGAVQSTTIEVKTQRFGSEAAKNDWLMDIAVKDANGKPVDAGDIKVETDKGTIEGGKTEWEGALDKGAKSIVWSGPQDKADKAKVKIKYFGDERDPAKPDKKYAECEKTVDMPPALIETKTTVTTAPASPADKTANDWTLEITVRDTDEKLVTAGFLSITTDKGGLEEKGKTTWEGAVAGGPAKVKWLGPKDRKDKAAVVIKFLGDEKDPAAPDKLYAESQTTVTLPPDAVETKVEVQTTLAKAAAGANDWKLDVLVKDEFDKPVEMGEVKIEAQDGGIEKQGAKEWAGPLKSGKLQVTWFGPADTKKKVAIKLTYLGDEKDPAVPDAVYKESETTIELPRALATEISYKAAPDPKDPKKWEVEIEVKDELGRKVDTGILDIEVSDGSVEQPGSTKTGCDFADTKGKDKFKFPFFAPNDPKKKAKFTVHYFGDQKDPAVPDEIFKDSDKTFQLPPEVTLTNIQVANRKVNPTDPKSNDWIMEFSVKEENGIFVAAGDIKVECSEGALEVQGKTEWEGALKDGKATVKWLGPDDPKKIATIKVKYFGDQKDPTLPDLKYGECEKTFKMPPKSLKPTTVNIIPSLVDEKKKIWKLEIEVSDEKGAPVTKGSVRYTATGGSFADGKLVLEYQKELTAGKHEKGWKQTEDDQKTITVKYLGDEADPVKEDTIYEESEASVKLPPDPLEKSTVFIIDASGSMSGAKLASAKEAVRAALAGYVGKDNKEEWALYAFFDCGNCRLLQAFTRDPGLVMSKLGFDAAGSTPIASSLRIASNYLRRAARGKTGRVILLSDGGENCSGKPIEEAKSMRVRTISVDLTK
jgi:hypothetical protein